jgi:hypothetical protein
MSNNQPKSRMDSVRGHSPCPAADNPAVLRFKVKLAAQQLERIKQGGSTTVRGRRADTSNPALTTTPETRYGNRYGRGQGQSADTPGIPKTAGKDIKSTLGAIAGVARSSVNATTKIINSAAAPNVRTAENEQENNAVPASEFVRDTRVFRIKSRHAAEYTDTRSYVPPKTKQSERQKQSYQEQPYYSHKPEYRERTLDHNYNPNSNEPVSGNVQAQTYMIDTNTTVSAAFAQSSPYSNSNPEFHTHNFVRTKQYDQSAKPAIRMGSNTDKADKSAKPGNSEQGGAYGSTERVKGRGSDTKQNASGSKQSSSAKKDSSKQNNSGKPKHFKRIRTLIRVGKYASDIASGNNDGLASAVAIPLRLLQREIMSALLPLAAGILLVVAIMAGIVNAILSSPFGVFFSQEDVTHDTVRSL